MNDEKIHEIEISLTKIELSDKSAHKRIDGLETDVKDIDEKVLTNEKKISTTNIILEGMGKTITEIQESVKSINQLAFSVHEIANEMKAMRTDINKNDEYGKGLAARVKKIEEKPAKKYETIVEKVILVVVGGVAGYFLMQMGM